MLAPGAIVANDYRIDARLGAGGMGVVWAATHVPSGSAVALKVIGFPESHEARRRFLREARAAGAIEHPNVVRILGVVALDDDSPVIVMERLWGETLKAKLEREERLSPRDTARALLPVCLAVTRAHELGVVHRDLKPSNLFYADYGAYTMAKVLDFGIAKIIGASGFGATLAALTGNGATLGTIGYMAPEQVDASFATPKADVWSLGTVLYECLSGGRPVEGSTVLEFVRNAMFFGITPLAASAPDVPPELASAVDRMLTPDAPRRPGDLAEITAVLTKLARLAPASIVRSPQLRRRYFLSTFGRLSFCCANRPRKLASSSREVRRWWRNFSLSPSAAAAAARSEFSSISSR